jgi:tetratricopeptide (TPR) repeat protein
MLRNAVFLAALLLFGASPASASPLSICLEGARSTSAEDGIAACSEVLSGKLSRDRRAKAYVNRGMWHTQLDPASDRAVEDFTDAILLGKYSPYISRAEVHVEAERFDQALADIAQFMKRDKGDPFAWLVRGRANLGVGDAETAIADLTRALKLDSDGVDILYYRGLAHQAAGDGDKALKDWDRAIKLEPRYAKPYEARVALLVGRGEHKRAIDDYTKIMDLSPASYIDALFARAKSYVELDELFLAFMDMKKLLELSPTEEMVAYYDALDKRMVDEGLLSPKAE